MSNPTIDDCEFIRSETVKAGNFLYETDVLKMPTPDGDNIEINHIEQSCPNCEAIGELAIELRTDSVICPICDYREKIRDTHLSSAVYIGDVEPPE